MKRNKTKLRLPFKGRWLTFWGGDTEDLNAHHGVVSQKYAFDFVAVDEKGNECQGEGKQNQNYYSFGQEILAPAAGKIVEAFDGIKDTQPGDMKSYIAEGNTVVIKHQGGEFSVLCHLKQDSVEVQTGEEVNQGEIIGRCGDSGNASEPHLHYHLQNQIIPQEANGIKCYFSELKLKKNGDFVLKEEYSPVRGDIIIPVNSE